MKISKQHRITVYILIIILAVVSFGLVFYSQTKETKISYTENEVEKVEVKEGVSIFNEAAQEGVEIEVEKQDAQKNDSLGISIELDKDQSIDKNRKVTIIDSVISGDKRIFKFPEYAFNFTCDTSWKQDMRRSSEDEIVFESSDKILFRESIKYGKGVTKEHFKKIKDEEKEHYKDISFWMKEVEIDGAEALIIHTTEVALTRMFAYKNGTYLEIATYNHEYYVEGLRFY